MSVAERPETESVTTAPIAVEVRNLRIELVSSHKDIVDEIGIRIGAGEVLGLVGESGSGKTTVGMSLLGYCRPGGYVSGGAIVIDGTDLAGLDEPEVRQLRGGVVSYIPQDPGTALNPALRLRTQLAEQLAAHRATMSAEARPADARDARGGTPALGRQLPAPLPAPALRRSAAARRDRDGVRLPPAGDRL